MNAVTKITFSTSLAATLWATGCQHVDTTKRAVTPVTEAAPRGGPAYVFGWGELPVDLARPRGGTSRGAPVTLAAPSELPLAEIASGANAFERDRAAILALAGDFRTSFHFMETIGLTPQHAPGQPYHSWATEHVRVLEDTGRFISLQHTLVMFFQKENGAVSEPMLVKHWRQDWTYEATELHTFRGERTWERRHVTPEDAAGAWSQAVWQVDDSPRYAAVGRWSHDGNRSVWTGETSWRPLPRREFSVRKDYDVLEGVHQIVLTPTGWLHVQDNWKRVAGDLPAAAAVAGHAEAAPASTTPAMDSRDDSPTGPQYVGHEYGLDRYERITAPSLAAADYYWSKTGAYWAAVRAAWREVLAEHDRFSLAATVDGERLFEVHFAYADGLISDGESYDPVEGARHARETIGRFLVDAR